MSAHASIFDQVAHDQRAPSKQKWRDKFFSNEGKSKKHAVTSDKLNQDVDEFLRPSSSRSGSKASLDLPVPRIDISSALRWPSATEVSQTYILKPSSPRRKTPRKEGLRVAFVSAAPDVIGEGGDDAELPAIAVSRSKGPLNNQLSSQRSSPKPVAISLENSTDDSYLKNDERHSPLMLQRRPTGLDGSLASDFGNRGTNSPSPSKSDVSVAAPSTYGHPPNTLAELRSNNMDYTETSQNAGHLEAAHQEVGPQALAPGRPNHSTEATILSMPALGCGLSISNSLTPIPTPSVSVEKLSATISKENGQSLKSDYFQPLHDQTSQNSGKASPRPEAEVLKSQQESRPFTFRSLAKNLGDDALREFGGSVERFNGIFQLGAAASSPLMEIPFEQWIRTAAFWFLRGRGALEATVRLNGRLAVETDQVGSREISRNLGQAYLDLAKAWWIVESITPNHPEPKKVGSTGMSSLMTIATSFGEKKLAERIGVHLAIIANMRALAMSMKRNNRLPTSSFEIQGLDTRIFVKYPVLSPRVANLFSHHFPSLTLDSSPDEKSFFPILVGDTKRHFLYSTSFVDLTLAAPSDVREQITFLCALSVLRERTARGLQVAIASQDGQINIVIQSSSKDGLTWEDVHWDIKTHRIRLKIAENVDAHVQFSEQDFKTLWGIHDYTKKIQKGLQCREGEREVFNIELPSFQNLDQENSKLFPTGPIKHCSVRLYEKKRAFSEAARGIKCYDGHRLVVVTPSDIKTLSSINLECGKQKPVLFSYLRGDGSAPALHLRFPKPASISSMVMTFEETESRGLFHSLLNGTSTSTTESSSQPLPIKTFAVSPIQSNGFGSIPGQNFLNTVNWQQLRVINGDAKGTTHGIPRTFEHLRIWLEAEVGSFVDHMDLGKQLGSYEQEQFNWMA
jgi:hypothetical protein